MCDFQTYTTVGARSCQILNLLSRNLSQTLLNPTWAYLRRLLAAETLYQTLQKPYSKPYLSISSEADCLLQELDGLQVLLPQVICLSQNKEPLRLLHQPRLHTLHILHLQFVKLLTYY